jgi:hypothetical protein
MNKLKKELFINGVEYNVPIQVFDLVAQLLNENQLMINLLDDCYFLNREVDDIEIVSQISNLN